MLTNDIVSFEQPGPGVPFNRIFMLFFLVGLIDVVGQCSAGHFCPVGSIQPTEEQCTVGHFCEVGTEFPTPCPNGTFSNTLGLMASTDCTPCTEGYFCNGEGLTAVSGDCKQGNTVIIIFLLL